MITEARQHFRETFRERMHLRPVRFTRSIHHHADHAAGPTGGQQFRRPVTEALILQVIVRIVKTRGHNKSTR